MTHLHTLIDYTITNRRDVMTDAAPMESGMAHSVVDVNHQNACISYLTEGWPLLDALFRM